jgi:hypothetical protein
VSQSDSNLVTRLAVVNNHNNETLERRWGGRPSLPFRNYLLSAEAESAAYWLHPTMLRVQSSFFADAVDVPEVSPGRSTTSSVEDDEVYGRSLHNNGGPRSPIPKRKHTCSTAGQKERRLKEISSTKPVCIQDSVFFSSPREILCKHSHDKVQYVVYPRKCVSVKVDLATHNREHSEGKYKSKFPTVCFPYISTSKVDIK